MRRLAMIALWVVATGVTTGVAYIAVNAAGASVTDRPLTAVVAADVSPTTIAAASTIQGSTTVPSTSFSASSTSTASTSPTTSTSSAPWEQTTVNSAAGAVIVSYRPNEVRLESVVPLASFSYQIEKAGPDEVRVEFVAADLRVEIRIRWENGALITEVDENS